VSYVDNPILISGGLPCYPRRALGKARSAHHAGGPQGSPDPTLLTAEARQFSLQRFSFQVYLARFRWHPSPCKPATYPACCHIGASPPARACRMMETVTLNRHINLDAQTVDQRRPSPPSSAKRVAGSNPRPRPVPSDSADLLRGSGQHVLRRCCWRATRFIRARFRTTVANSRPALLRRIRPALVVRLSSTLSRRNWCVSAAHAAPSTSTSHGASLSDP
jgi:hypothetical protein